MVSQFRNPQPSFQPITNGELVKRAYEHSPIKIEGSRKVYLVVFLDVNCPVCKALLERSGDMLIDYAKSGVISLGLCTYTLFEESEKLHRFLNCVSEDQRMDLMMRIIRRERIEPNCEGENKCTEIGKALGVIGTPTLVGFNYVVNRGYRFDGYLGPSEIAEFIDRLVMG